MPKPPTMVGTPLALPCSSEPATPVQLPAAVESAALKVAIERRYSVPGAAVGAAGAGRPMGKASPSLRTLTILLRSPTYIHGSPERVGRCGTSETGSPL